jgi:hypothetical protein
MAQISSYPTLTPQFQDKVLGSNNVDSAGQPVVGNPTVQYNFTDIKTLVDQDYVSQLESSSASAAQASGQNTAYSIRFGTPIGGASDNIQLLQGTGSVTDGDKILFNTLGTYQITLTYLVGVTQSATNVPLLVFRTLQDGTTQVGPTVVFNEQLPAINKPIPLIIPITVQITVEGTYYNFQMARSGVNDGGLINLSTQGGINAGITPTFTAASSASIKISKLI